MNKEEAKAWIRGERSHHNSVYGPGVSMADGCVRVAEADCAAVKQAYYVLRAYKEGLIDE